MNKRGQMGVFTLLFFDITFFVLWALVLADLLSYWGQQAITQHSLTGLEAFLYGNLNFLVLIGVILVNVAVVVAGGSE